MRPEDMRAWRAETPSAGFADRATAAVLRDRATARRRRVARRWVPLAAACLLVAGGAWGWTALPSHVVPSTTETAPLPPIRHEEPVPTSTVPAAPPLVIAPAVPKPRPTATASTAVGVPSAAPSAKLRLPSCTCNEFACDCGPLP